MKAVNLLPAEARHAGEVRLRGASPGTLAVLGALVLGVLVMASFVVLSNQASSRRTQLAQVTAEANAVQAQAAKLKHFGDIIAQRNAAVQEVRTVAEARYNWSAVLARVARALPANVTLTTLNASLASAGSASAPAAASTTTTSPTGPTVVINGCADSHTAAGQIMQRLRTISGVMDVTLQSSTIAGASAGGGGGCGRPETFALTVALKAPTTSTSTTAATVPGATAGTTTTPSSTAPAAPSTTSSTSTPTATATAGS